MMALKIATKRYAFTCERQPDSDGWFEDNEPEQSQRPAGQADANKCQRRHISHGDLDEKK